MPKHAAESATRPKPQIRRASTETLSSVDGERTVELSDWIERRIPYLKNRWLRELHSRFDVPRSGVNTIIEDFLDALLACLPAMLGPHREQVEALWIRCAELFGTVGARRGLAAGEVIDEFQLLREGVVRLLYQDPPEGGRVRLSLRDVLRLNRAIDTGVTHASVGHTDALFFAHFQGSGIPVAPPTPVLMREVRSQLHVIKEELREALGRGPVDRDPPSIDEG